MTDLDNREAFEKYMKKEHPFINQKSEAYEAMEKLWKASTQRQGFKFVPLEPSKEMLKSADNCGIDGKVTANIIYKAMVNAV